MELTAEQRRELELIARRGEPAALRRKALALLHLAQGWPVQQVATVLRVTRRSVYQWRDRYQAAGVAGWRLRPGRGRKAKADLEQLKDYVRQSPRTFGVARTRWTLETLAQVVPSIKGFSLFGVHKALQRAGITYKRGQPVLHSPDPQYQGKKGHWSER